MEFFLFLLRWLHVFFGIIWIGHLYYFNFVQGAFFAETDASTKSNAIQKLVPRALWWFRWGAMWTFLSGWTFLAIRGHMGGIGLFASPWGAVILTGAILGSLMWFNVWFIIWPSQKIVIESASLVAQGKTALPNAAAVAARAGLASRTNTFFSIPLLFFMTGANHMPLMMHEQSHLMAYAAIAGAMILGIQLNGMFGKTGPLTTIRGVISSGFVLTGIFYLLLAFCL